MEEDAENLRLLAKCAVDMNLINGVDRLSNLPDCLLCDVLLCLRTEDVVNTSALSKRWRNLWKCVPRLDLAYDDFPDYDAVVSFIDRFLGFGNDGSKLLEFKLKSESSELKSESLEPKLDGEPDVAHVPRWISTVLNRKLEHLKVLERRAPYDKNLEILQTVYTCETLVTLKLRDVLLPDPLSSSVSLPRVKTIKLVAVAFANGRTFEMLISGCPVLESLYVKRCPYEDVHVFLVRSQSLRRFTLIGHDDYEVEGDDGHIATQVAIDAPKLEYLRLFEDQTHLYMVNHLGSLVKVDIDTRFNLPYEYRDMLDPDDLPKRKIIRDFLMGISSVRDMVITSDTLEIIYDLSRCEPEPIPLLRNLSSLRANFFNDRWEVLPVFLESCPNLKSISLSFSEDHWEQAIDVSPGPRRLLPTLEYVEIDKAMIGDVVGFLKLASYFLEKSSILKEFTLCSGDFSEEEEEQLVILKKLLAIRRLSSSCQVLIL